MRAGENKSKPTSNSTLKAIFDKKYIINKLEYSDGSPSKMDTLEYESTDKNGNSTYKMGKQTKKDIDNGIYPK